MDKDKFDSWLSTGSKFVKIKVGQKYTCIFDSMKFTEDGGFGGKAAVVYSVKDLKDNIVRTFSSASKNLAQQMMKVKSGDTIVIAASLDTNDRKVYQVVVKSQAASIEPDPNAIPF